MKFVTLTLTGALLFASCTKSANNTEVKSSQVATEVADNTPVDLQRMWYIENVVVNDTLYARPAEIDNNRNQTFTFADGSFGINTNCNTIGGEYELNGDSISFKNIMITEMACDNMDVEQLLVRILPEITSVDCINDSITRLNTPNSAYIVLKKSPYKGKCNQPDK